MLYAFNCPSLTENWAVKLRRVQPFVWDGSYSSKMEKPRCWGQQTEKEKEIDTSSNKPTHLDHAAFCN